MEEPRVVWVNFAAKGNSKFYQQRKIAGSGRPLVGDSGAAYSGAKPQVTAAGEVQARASAMRTKNQTISRRGLGMTRSIFQITMLMNYPPSGRVREHIRQPGPMEIPWLAGQQLLR
jgi:hypothetical protein